MDNSQPPMDNSQPPMTNQPIPPQANLPPPLQPDPTIINPPNNKKRYLLVVSIVFLVISAFLMSLFYFANQRQPKTQTNAKTPQPTIKPVTQNPQPTTSSRSGFSSLISSPSISPTDQISPISSSNPIPTIDNPQPTNNNQPPAANQPADQRPSRVILDITASGNSFKPNQFEAFNNQIIVLNVFATDHDYDISIEEFGVKKVFKQGIRSSMEFQATSFGLYTFICKDNCDGADSARGLLTIQP